MTPVLAAISAAQDRPVAEFQIIGAIGHAENPDARLGADRDIPERTIRAAEAHHSGDRHVDARIGRHRIGQLRRYGLAARRPAGLFRMREGRAVDEKGIGQERLCGSLPRSEDERETNAGAKEKPG